MYRNRITRCRYPVVTLLACALWMLPVLGGQAEAKSNKFWDMVSLGTVWYLNYNTGEGSGKTFNKFHVGRGYLTTKFKPFSWFESRITMDTHQDDKGDFKVRLKYLYARFKFLKKNRYISNAFVEFGQVHIPWLDYEEHINYYRMQGTMMIERNGLSNSADLGITVGALIGRKLPRAYRDKVNAKYPGSWGSFAFGIYNGGGYHAEEKNEGKVFQARLSFRPVGPFFPNLQFSYYVVYGDGNQAARPDWRSHLFFLSFEHQYFVVTGQYALGRGHQKGDNVETDGSSTDFKGYSFFTEIKLPWIRSSLIARYDWFRWGPADRLTALSRVIAGYAFHLYKRNTLLLDVDYVNYDDPRKKDDWTVKLTLQVCIH